MKPKASHRRCAIYTRKSSEEGLDQDFNSLQAQRESCEAFIRSQQGEGWKLVETHYDDGGLSGGNMERPALQRLLADVALGRVDVVVVYKVDRLTRSLADFAKIVEVFDARGASFVAVTQQFNTTTSMGRLTLNVLLSFAQFEREVTGERIRDKIAASKEKGIWMGGPLPLGYRVEARKLIVVPEEAARVNLIFQTYLKLGNVRVLKAELDRLGIRSKSRVRASGESYGCHSFSRGALYILLSNPIYIGRIRHREISHPGQHEPIIDQQLWDAVQTRLRSQAVREGIPNGKAAPNWLIGKLIDESGGILTTAQTSKEGRRYRYYISRPEEAKKPDAPSSWRLPAAEIERVVAGIIAKLLSDRALIVKAAQEAGIAHHEIPSVLARAADVGPCTNPGLLKHVRLAEDGLTVSVLLELSPGGEHDGPRPLELVKQFPMRLKRRGIEVRLILGGIHRPPQLDYTLLRAIAQGRKWFDQIAIAEVKSVTDIARAEGVTERWVTRILPLAFLSPSLVNATLEGRQPADLSTQRLIYGLGLPANWDEQERQFGLQ